MTKNTYVGSVMNLSSTNDIEIRILFHSFFFFQYHVEVYSMESHIEMNRI